MDKDVDFCVTFIIDIGFGRLGGVLGVILSKCEMKVLIVQCYFCTWLKMCTL